jgi:hypothetical protein
MFSILQRTAAVRLGLILSAPNQSQPKRHLLINVRPVERIEMVRSASDPLRRLGLAHRRRLYLIVPQARKGGPNMIVSPCHHDTTCYRVKLSRRQFKKIGAE